MRKERYQEEQKVRHDRYTKTLDDKYNIRSKSYQNLSAPGFKIKEEQ
jgi:hypothetical protein